ncbi:hypothetical protein HY629_03015 [Candidatus Uhrbacteria bacterium]|nr:hypothetical protein [Candidatus Uhrbacteria bacterium]
MIGRIIIGFLISGAGVGLTFYADKIYENFGGPEFADKYFGSSGGGRFFYKMLGVLAAFIGFLVIFNLHQGFVQWILGIFIPGVRQQNTEGL